MTLTNVATGKMRRTLGANAPAVGGDTSNGGLVGGLSAEQGVNISGTIVFAQSSGAGAFTGVLPNPADTTIAWTVTLVNVGAVALTVYGTRILGAQGARYVWAGGGWRPVVSLLYGYLFNLDFSDPATSYSGLVTTVTGGPFALSRSTTTYAMSVGASDACFEDRGGAAGGGVGCWSVATNDSPNAFDFQAAAGWTVFSAGGPAPVFANGPATRPDGVTPAQSMQRPVGNTGCTSFAVVANGARMDVFWMMDKASDPPTSPGSLLRTGAVGTALPAAPQWTRYVVRYPAGLPSNTVGFGPAGLTPAGAFVAASGTVYAAGYYSGVTAPDCERPVANGTSGVKQKLAATEASLAISGGDLDIEVDLIVTTSSWSGQPDGSYEITLSTPDGLAGVRWDLATSSLALLVRGGVVFNTSASLSNTIAQFSTGDQKYRLRAWYKPSTGQAGLRTVVNGSLSTDYTGAAVGPALAPATDVWLGSNAGAANFFEALCQGVRRPTALTDSMPEYVFIGDSLIGRYIAGTSRLNAATTFLYTAEEAAEGRLAGLLAYMGSTVAQQKVAWLASPWRTQSLRAVFIQIGLNNVVAGELAAPTTAEIQDLYDTVRADQPNALIVLSLMTPAAGASGLTAPQVLIWSAINDNIRGTGANPIVLSGPGDNRIMTSCTDIGGAFTLNDGANGLLSQYKFNDLHTNASGRARQMQAARAEFVAGGVW